MKDIYQKLLIDPEIKAAFLGVVDKYLHPKPNHLQVWTDRVYHKWTKNKKWKERERAGTMSVLDFSSTKEDIGMIHGAN